MAKDLDLPTAAELLPILASALGTSVEGTTVDQLRAASDLLAEHDEWRSERADLSAGESVGDFPDASDWHASDDAGCDLADRAIALLAELTGQTSHAGEGSEPGTASDVSLQRSMLLEAPPTTASTQPDHTADATSTKRSGPAR